MPVRCNGGYTVHDPEKGNEKIENNFFINVIFLKNVKILKKFDNKKFVHDLKIGSCFYSLVHVQNKFKIPSSKKCSKVHILIIFRKIIYVSKKTSPIEQNVHCV